MPRKENQSKSLASSIFDASTLGPIRHRDGPIYMHVYRRLAQLIDDGSLNEGARLPPSRFLAGQLAVSRFSVSYAYSLLAADGYIASRGRAGTFVRRFREHRLAPDGRADAPVASRPTTGAPMFSVGLAPMEFFPRKVWVNLVKRRYGGMAPGDLLPQDPQGGMTLRRALANRLAITRGIFCTPDQIFVTAGMPGATALTAAAMVKNGDRVLVEDPSDPRCFQAMGAAGAELIPVHVDNDGMRIEEGLASCPNPRLTVVTPACQYPMGVTLSMHRRRVLLDRLRSTESYAFEHDIQTDYRFSGSAVRSLASESEGRGVIYALHLSEIVFPSLHISCVAVPPELVESFRAACARLPPIAGPIEQGALADLVRRGHILRFFSASHAACARRREALREAFDELGARTYVPDAGLHMLVALRRPPDRSALSMLREQGFAPESLSRYSSSGHFPPALVVGFASVAEANARNAVRLLTQYVELAH